MRKKKLGTLIIITMLALSGCSNQQKMEPVNWNEVLLVYDNQTITFDEAQVYVEATRMNYSSYYGNDSWDTEIETGDGEKQKLQDLVKNDAIEQLKMTKVMCNKADEFGLSLDEEDKESAKVSAEEFIEFIGGNERLEELNLTEDDVLNVFLENTLANKTYEKVTSEADVEINKDDYKTRTLYDVSFEFVEYDDNFKETELSAKEKKKLKQDAEKLAKAAKSDDISELASKYKSAYVSTMQYNAATEDYYDPLLIKAAEKLTTVDDTSAVIETDTAYHVLQLISNNDKEATESNIEAAENEKKSEYFSEVYKGWVEELEENYDAEKDVNQKLYDKFNFNSSSTEDDSSEETTSSSSN